MFWLLKYPQGTGFFVTTWVNLVFWSVLFCTATLIAPKIFTSSGRVRIMSPGLNFLLNWIQNQNGSLSLVLRLWISQRLGESGWSCDFYIWSILKCLTRHLVPLLGKNLSIPQHRYVELITYVSYSILGPLHSLLLLLRQQIQHLQVSHTGNTYFALLLWSSINLCSVGAAAHLQELSVKLLH